MLFNFSLAPLLENISVESGLILLLRNEFLVRSWAMFNRSGPVNNGVTKDNPAQALLLQQRGVILRCVGAAPAQGWTLVVKSLSTQ